MPLTFPLAIPPELHIRGMTLTLKRFLAQSPLRSGKSIAIEMARSKWIGDWRSTPLTREQAGKAQAWVDSLGNTESFLAYDPRKQYPLNYTSFDGLTVGGLPFSGNAALDSVTDAKVLALSALPVGFKLADGDHLAYSFSTHRALHRVVAGATAGGDGKMNVEVRPFVIPGWQAGAAVALYRPSAEMFIEPESYSEDQDDNGYLTVSFRAVQKP